MTTKNQELTAWVSDVAKHTQPQKVVWCDGSEEEYQQIVDLMLNDGSLSSLNSDTHPDCYLHLSDPQDVARVEHLTFICSDDPATVGDNNNWMPVADAKEKMNDLYQDCMKGRTMYVIPYCMGPIDSPYSRCGVEITDSPYVVINMKLMTRMGTKALSRIEAEGSFVKGLHSIGELDPDRRFIMHFPEELSIMSYGSGYGGNALLGKKCHALRIASWQARKEGWLAEHMLILGLESPEGETHYIAAAFPSACGKTNLAMLIPPEKYKDWKVWTLGDDIAWLHKDTTGLMRAINPEAGYFGVVPGTNAKTNRNAYDMIQQNTIFTNVGTTADNQPWWEDKKVGQPETDWKGNDYDANAGPAAHPNSRFTVSATENKAYSSLAEAAEGVPITAIVFGGRRRELAPLVYQAKSWEHGVMIGAGVASETTAAATGQVGIVRRDPMAMKPFCGYNFADYWAHWLSFAERTGTLPKIFHVNWFRQDDDGKFLWPGFGENLRVLQWIIKRCKGEVGANETAIGYLPCDDDIDIEGLDIDPAVWQSLITIDDQQWRQEMDEFGEYLESYGDRLPDKLREQHQQVRAALG
ncbi:MAG: phosphoenolpyruvate carboxykinase (GTP) [Arenicella sp.]|nr:phosphoenolpyruvate carboxykinase (GTP) [Arenicella sp.]